MKFQLFLNTSNEELFRKATCELGTLFYRAVNAEKGKGDTEVGEVSK